MILLRKPIVYLLVALVIPLIVRAQDPQQLSASVEVIEAGVLWRSAEATDENDWQIIDDTSLLADGDALRTDETGVAVLTWFADGTLVELSPNTELVVNEFSQAADGEAYTVDFSLLSGRVFNSVRSLVASDSSYRLSVSNRTLVVRGTVFAVEVTDDGSLTVAVLDGVVTMINDADPATEITINAGQVFVAPTAGSARLVPLAEAELAWLDAIDTFWQEVEPLHTPEANGDDAPIETDTSLNATGVNNETTVGDTSIDTNLSTEDGVEVEVDANVGDIVEVEGDITLDPLSTTIPILQD